MKDLLLFMDCQALEEYQEPAFGKGSIQVLIHQIIRGGRTEDEEREVPERRGGCSRLHRWKTSYPALYPHPFLSRTPESLCRG